MAKKRGAAKPPPPAAKHTVVVDTREKAGFEWQFRPGEWLAGSVRAKLDTGDYALLGLEHVCTIDRKRSTAELSTNLLDDRFYRELERMRGIAYPMVVCEFPYAFVERYPEDSGIPAFRRRYLRVTGPLLVKKLCEAQLAYPHVHWHFAGSVDLARVYTRSLLKRVAFLNSAPQVPSE